MRITTLDGNTLSVDHIHLVHAANILPELLDAAKNLQVNCAGTDVHAVADTYGGSDHSGVRCHERLSIPGGVQNALIDILLQK